MVEVEAAALGGVPHGVLDALAAETVGTQVLSDLQGEKIEQGTKLLEEYNGHFGVSYMPVIRGP